MAKSYLLDQADLTRRVQAQKAYYGKTDADLCSVMLIGANGMTSFWKNPGKVKLYSLRLMCRALKMEVTIHKDGKIEVHT